MRFDVMQNKKLDFQINNQINLLLLALNILFIVYYVFLAFYNRLSQDDFLFLKSVGESDSLNFVKGAYLNQSGRFIGYAFNFLVYLLIDKTGYVFLIPIFIWIIDLFFLNFALKIIFPTNLFVSLNLSAILLNIFIITNFEFTAFYWICASFSYVIPILTLLLFILINKKRITKNKYVLLVLISIIISGSSEVFVPITLLFLLFNLYYIYLSNQKQMTNFFSDSRTKRLRLSFLILFIGLIIVVLAPGNYNRATETIFHRPESLIDFIIISLKSFALFFYLLAFKFPYYIILILISFSVGCLNKAKVFLQFNYTRFLLLSWGGYLLFVLLSVMPAAFLMSGFGFQRIYTTTIFFSILFFIVQGYYFGLNYKKSLNLKLGKKLILLNLLVLILVMCANLYMDIPTARKYAQSDIKRTKYLLELKRQGHKGLVELEPLYKPSTINLKYLIVRQKQPMLYYWNEIEKDTAGYTVGCMKTYYEIDFPFCLKSE